jgi:hypothetical protein
MRPGPLVPINLPNLKIIPLSYSLKILIALAKINKPMMIRVKTPAPAITPPLKFRSFKV